MESKECLLYVCYKEGSEERVSLWSSAIILEKLRVWKWMLESLGRGCGELSAGLGLHPKEPKSLSALIPCYTTHKLRFPTRIGLQFLFIKFF